MTRLKSALAKGALIATAAAGVLAATAPPASAYVACNRLGECWHVRDRAVAYPPGLGVILHDDGWRVRHHRYYQWRGDRDDRGYWNHGHWRRF